MKIIPNDKHGEFLEKARVYALNPAIRKGQAYMNALYVVAPEVYDEITGTEFDCFYVDARIEAFLNRVF